VSTISSAWLNAGNNPTPANANTLSNPNFIILSLEFFFEHGTTATRANSMEGDQVAWTLNQFVGDSGSDVKKS
jgi:hypothetical protein